MLGLFLIYYIGKTYSTLAKFYGKNKLVFTILGIAAYYVGAFLVGLSIGLYNEFFDATVADDLSDLKFGLLALPFGILASVILYHSLKYFWAKEEDSQQSLNTLDEGIF